MVAGRLPRHRLPSGCSCSRPLLRSRALAAAEPAVTVPAPAASGPLTLELGGLTPACRHRRRPATVTVTGTLRNTGDRPVDDLEVRLQRGEALRTDGDVRDALAGDGRVDAATPAFTPLPGTLAPGGSLPVATHRPAARRPDGRTRARPAGRVRGARQRERGAARRPAGPPRRRPPAAAGAVAAGRSGSRRRRGRSPEARRRRRCHRALPAGRQPAPAAGGARGADAAHRRRPRPFAGTRRPPRRAAGGVRQGGPAGLGRPRGDLPGRGSRPRRDRRGDAAGLRGARAGRDGAGHRRRGGGHLAGHAVGGSARRLRRRPALRRRGPRRARPREAHRPHRAGGRRRGRSSPRSSARRCSSHHLAERRCARRGGAGRCRGRRHAHRGAGRRRRGRRGNRGDGGAVPVGRRPDLAGRGAHRHPADPGRGRPGHTRASMGRGTATTVSARRRAPRSPPRTRPPPSCSAPWRRRGSRSAAPLVLAPPHVWNTDETGARALLATVGPAARLRSAAGTRARRRRLRRTHDARPRAAGGGPAAGRQPRHPADRPRVGARDACRRARPALGRRARDGGRRLGRRDVHAAAAGRAAARVGDLARPAGSRAGGGHGGGRPDRGAARVGPGAAAAQPVLVGDDRRAAAPDGGERAPGDDGGAPEHLQHDRPAGRTDPAAADPAAGQTAGAGQRGGRAVGAVLRRGDGAQPGGPGARSAEPPAGALHRLRHDHGVVDGIRGGAARRAGGVPGGAPDPRRTEPARPDGSLGGPPGQPRSAGRPNPATPDSRTTERDPPPPVATNPPRAVPEPPTTPVGTPRDPEPPTRPVPARRP